MVNLTQLIDNVYQDMPQNIKRSTLFHFVSNPVSSCRKRSVSNRLREIANECEHGEWDVYSHDQKQQLFDGQSFFRRVSTTNNHLVRTEHNMSPNQLFVSGILASESRTTSILEDVVNPQFCIEEDGTPPPIDDGGAVVCDPPTLNILLNTAH